MSKKASIGGSGGQFAHMQIPENWDVLKIGRMFSRRMEHGHAGLPVMSITMTGGLVERDSVERRVDSNLPPEGHLLVRAGDLAYNMMRMWQGVLGRGRFDCLVSPAYIVLQPREMIDPEFAEYLFSTGTAIAEFKRLSYGVVDDRLRLYYRDLVRIPFAVPRSRVEQRRIAEILSTLDETIAQTEDLIAKYQQIKAGLMHDLLTRGVTQDGHLRPTRAQAPQLYRDAPLGWIPTEWKCLRLEELLAKTASPMRSGPFGSALLKDELVEQGIPLLGIDNVFAERFVEDYHRFVSRPKFNDLLRYAVFPRDVIITIMGTVGRCCVVPNHVAEALSSKHLWTMTLDANRVVPELVCWQLNYARWVQDWFTRHSQGAVMEAIQSSTLKNLWLPVPPLQEQHRILLGYQLSSCRIDHEREFADKLRQLKQGLMHDLLTGRVRVDVTESEQVPA